MKKPNLAKLFIFLAIIGLSTSIILINLIKQNIIPTSTLTIGISLISLCCSVVFIVLGWVFYVIESLEEEIKRKK